MNKKKLRRYLQELRYIIPTLYFNFRYPPWRQAIKLPIVLYKPHLLACKGKVMHSVTTPEHCTWGMGTIITRVCVKKPYCLMGGSPVQVLREHVKNTTSGSLHNIENND